MQWLVDTNGIVYDADKKPFGYFDFKGDVYDRHNINMAGAPSGTPAGSVDIAGDAYNAATVYLGFADRDGTIYTSGIVPIAMVTAAGEVRDLGLKLLGTVKVPLLHDAYQQDWCPMHLRAAVAVLLILLKK